MYVDFQTVKAQVPLLTVVQRYPVKLRQSNAHSWRGDCPLPCHTTKNESSFSIDTSKNCWACHSGGCKAARGGKTGGNLFDFVKYVEGLQTIREAAEKIAQWYNITSTTPGVVNHGNGYCGPKTEKPPEQSSGPTVAGPEVVTQDKTSTAVEENKPLTFTLKVEYNDYLKGRGLTAETCANFGVGLCVSKGSMAGRVVVPIHNPAGELVAYIGRSINGTEPRFKLPPNFHASQALFNFHRATGKSVILVEGVFDVLWLHQHGFPNVVALVGTNLSDTQADLICSKWKGAVVMMDGDDAGDEAASKIVDRLSRRIFVRRVDLERGKDPDNYDKAGITELLRF